jgi:NAD-dependent DNA ligase
MSVESLRKQVRQADAAYRAGAAVMSDAEFDALVEELRAVAPFAPELQQPGGGTALLSLDSCPLEEWWPGAPVLVQPKIDGAAVGLRYVDGELAAAWTRSGRDCMAVVRELVPQSVPFADELQVRGELWGHDGRQSTPAAALRRMKGGSGGLGFIAYGGAFQELTEVNAMALVGELGFDVVDSLLTTRIEEVELLHARWKTGTLWNRPWGTDGVVVKVVCRELQREMGDSSRAPRWALAVK